MSRTANRAINKRSAACLAFALCTITTAVNLQAPLYDALAARDGLGVGATSIAFACYVVGIIPVLLGLNGLADRVGRKPLIMSALLLCLLATGITLIAPGLLALGIARFLLGISTGLTSAVAPAYMQLLLGGEDNRVATNYVTASTALGFGLGAAVTSLFVFHTPSVSPPSLWIYLAIASLALVVVTTLKDPAFSIKPTRFIRLEWLRHLRYLQLRGAVSALGEKTCAAQRYSTGSGDFADCLRVDRLGSGSRLSCGGTAGHGSSQ